MHRFFTISLLGLCLSLTACDGDGPSDEDAGVMTGDDAGTSDACMGMADGSDCGSAMICIAEVCVETSCGDGFVDSTAAEECDDGNEVAFDGCEPSTCTFTCEDDSECDDESLCNGTETCTDNVCALGTPPADGATCPLDAGGDGVCRANACVDPGCGNGVVDGDEECDDGNDVDADGCDVDCTFSCTEDLDCADGDVCTGDETCDTTTNVCVPGTALDCGDGDDCTADECDPTDGCFNPLIDADMDGHAATTIGACGDDCDDTRADVYTGAEELCDGVDNNCNTDVDEVAPTWYIDCDDDGFAGDTDGSRTGCTEPPASATGCGGGWTNTRPVDMASTDCNDGNDDVFPGQTAYFGTAIPGESGNYDYDCSGGHSRRFSCTPSDGSCGTSCLGGYTPRSESNPNGCEYLCIGGGGCFVRTLPDCGETANYLNCGRVGSFCTSVRPSSRRQECR